MTVNIKTALIGSRFWLLANVLGICAYLLIEFWILAPRSEAESLNTTDVIHLWLITECPLLVAFLILNLVWMGVTIKRWFSNKSWQPLVAWSVVCLAWGVTLFAYGIAIGMLKVLIMMADRGA